MARPAKIGGNGSRIYRDLNRSRAVLRAHTGGDSKPMRSIDADGKGGPLFFSVLLTLLREPELVGALSSQREADQAARLTDHEVDELRRNQ